MYGGDSMYLSPYDKDAIYDFLSAKTTYDVDIFLKDKSDYQIYQIYNRIKTALVKYPTDIIEHLSSHPEAKPRYTLEELQNMPYNKLSELREKFGIKKGKKVTNTTIQPEAFKGALNIIEDKRTDELCADIIIQNSQHESILSISEVNTMYGEEWDNKFLENQGIVLEDVIKPPKKRLDREDIRLAKIDKIISSRLLIVGEIPSFEQLYSYNPSQLNKAYKLAKKAKP